RSLAGKRRTPRYPWVHLYDNHSSGPRIQRKLDIGPPGINAYFPYYRYGGVSHSLVFLIGECLCGCNSNGISCMDTHWIDIFYRTDDYYVVLLVPHDFQFKLFPPKNGFLNKHLAHRAELQSLIQEFSVFFNVICNASAGASE